ncbi:hypothetical protein MNBD_PLANCTO02-2565 [hydrothermal vent metagenome]|uniref:Uncharacterized protein n=1 Tax=hydrothermal vent metagenome TaxID=652676 RepID=A0A3B1DPM2_9ZZZZ
MSLKDFEMFSYVQLAEIAYRKQQQIGCVKFLILAGESAYHAESVGVAERCYQLVVLNNPQHLLARYPSFSEAVQDEDFQPFIKQLKRFCNVEKAEYLLARTEPENLLPSERKGNLSLAAMQLLERISLSTDE